MSNKSHDVTAPAVVEFTQNMLRALAEKHGGACTLNEVRVMYQINSCSFDGRTCSVIALHRVTGIPIPTASRSVASLQSEGWLSSRPDPDDGRKKVISLGPRTLKEARKDIDRAARWINDFREHDLLH